MCTILDKQGQIRSHTDLAKVSPHVLDPARFALHLGTHLLARYAYVNATFVTVEQLRWARINDSSEAGHPHAFLRDGAEKRFVEVEVARQGEGGAVARVAGGLRDLLGAGCLSFLPTRLI